MKTPTLILAAGLALVSSSFAVDPPPDGGYPNQNTAEGEDALFSLNSIAIENTAIGYHALYSDLNGSSNTAVGNNALTSNQSGHWNTAVGAEALANTTCTNANTAVGYFALAGSPTTCGGSDNVAIGYFAMSDALGYSCVAIGSSALSETTGDYNTAIGYNAMKMNTTGQNNTATGWRCLLWNTTGIENTAAGLEAMFYNTTGSHNTAMGNRAMVSNTTGDNNVAFGQGALGFNTSAGANSAIGVRALFKNTTGIRNTASGFVALHNNTTGSDNIGIGVGAGGNLTTGSDNIDIGNIGMAGESATIRIGTTGTHTKTHIAGINAATVPGGVGVVIDNNGQLGTVTSSARYKEQVTPMAESSEAILSLKPVSFRYKKDLDPKGIPQFGLVAEDVAKVDPDLVARDDEGEPYTVRYEAVNAMLLNEFLKEHKKVEEQATKLALQANEIAQLRSALTQVVARLDANGL